LAKRCAKCEKPSEASDKDDESGGGSSGTSNLAAKPVEGTALALECVDDVERGDGLALGVLGVGDCVADDAFEEGLEDAAGLFVDHCDE